MNKSDKSSYYAYKSGCTYMFIHKHQRKRKVLRNEWAAIDTWRSKLDYLRSFFPVSCQGCIDRMKSSFIESCLPIQHVTQWQVSRSLNHWTQEISFQQRVWLWYHFLKSNYASLILLICASLPITALLVWIIHVLARCSPVRVKWTSYGQMFDTAEKPTHAQTDRDSVSYCTWSEELGACGIHQHKRAFPDSLECLSSPNDSSSSLKVRGDYDDQLLKKYSRRSHTLLTTSSRMLWIKSFSHTRKLIRGHSFSLSFVLLMIYCEQWIQPI